MSIETDALIARPSIDEKGKGHWDDSYKVQTSPGLWCDEPVPFAEDAISRFIDAKTAIALELPCGDGKNTAYLANHLPALIAADSSPTALGIAAKRLQDGGVTNCILCKADVFKTQFLDDQFQATFCCDLLGHLVRAETALAELLRITRPGGLIIANVFGLGDSTRTADGMVRLNNQEYLYDEKFYFRFYSPVEVTALLSPFGAELLNVESVSWSEGPHEGYREYRHEHQSIVFSLRKRR